VSLNHTLILRFSNHRITYSGLPMVTAFLCLILASLLVTCELLLVFYIVCVCVCVFGASNVFPLMWPVADILSISGTYICSFISLISLHIQLVLFKAFMAASAINLSLTTNCIR